MDVRIVGVTLPGRTCGEYDNVHVGIQHRTEVVDLVPGDADRAEWNFSVNVSSDDGDVRGPYVQGRRGERFVYLSWGTVDGAGTFAMFRRAKLMLGAIDPGTIDAARQRGRLLVGTLAMTGADGLPRCAAVRPPAIGWAAVPAS